MKGLMYLIRQMVPYRGRILLALLLSALTISSHIGLMATAAYLLARAALHPPVMDLMVTIVGVRFFGISRAVLRYLERYVSHDVTFRILSRIRVSVYEAIEPLAPARLIYFKSGDLLSRIVSDVEIQKDLYLRVLAPPLVAVLVLLGFGLFLAPFDQRLPFILAAFFLLGGAGIPLGIKALGQSSGERKVKEKARLQVQALDLIIGMTELISFGQEEVYLEKIKTTQKGYSSAQRSYARLSGLSGATLGVVSNLGMWMVLVLGITLVGQGKLGGIYLGMLALGVLSSFESIEALPMSLQKLEENRAAADRLWELKESKPEVEETSKSSVASVRSEEIPFPLLASPALEISHLSFQYEQSETYGLKDISFEVPLRGKVGIVGPSGAGKSSLVHLFLRFWDYHEGSIKLGGKELHSLNSEEVRQFFGVVTQKTHLFNATVKENLLLAKPQSTDEELFEACRRAKIHDFILSLPQGYESQIGEEGLKLSGGQRQRLAIARVILKNAPILILDEATTGLDPVTERDVIQEIFDLMKDRTVLVISHHLPIMQNLDKVLVFNEGRILERGSHQELLSAGTLYTQLWERADIFRSFYGFRK
ncbi:thiol reductant ABC exporter subunit CydC [Desulfitobacterium metallireducens]|uniref:Cysteine ABC transporter permease n=1 Tax=Desulfitobacterium metallireducens DSM 15288 TaxID=871968 RepID=W0EB82_9FIRM|nr:thiol reductant ABC exporter subunit CydC [Desulfitobacterium metallireducens]AHF06311.1 cysteine ABC transporter permease [Desulfitobacterium metallireducens DSM 15288]